MLANYVGKLLFPRLQSSQYGQKFKVIAAAILLGLAVGGIVASVMIWQGAVGK
ncbi:MAG: hypothetical protein WBW41_06400 [Verrucomicrobiia bacterium]